MVWEVALSPPFGESTSTMVNPTNTIGLVLVYKAHLNVFWYRQIHPATTRLFLENTEDRCLNRM